MKIKNIAALAASTIALTACSDFVDIKTQGGIVPDEVENFRYLLNNTEEWWGASALPDIMSDDIYVKDGGRQYSAFTSEYYEWFAKAYVWSSEIYPATGYYNKDYAWNAMYNTSAYANTVINEVGNCKDGTQAEKDELIAEAKVHRADAYLMLVNQYAKPYNASTASTDLGVPLILTQNTAQKVVRASVQKVYDQIIKDLTEALPFLPETQNFTTLPTKASAYGELARAYLLMGNYEEADRYATLALEQNSTVNNLNDEEQPDNIKNQEILLMKKTVQMNSQWSCTMLHLSDDILNLLGEKDLRYQKWTAETATYATLYADDGGRLYYADLAKSYRNVGPSVPEMMLIKAEYYARNNQPTEAMQWVNRLRVNRFAPADYVEETATDADDALKKVIDERHREFFCRNLRWYDLRRLQNDSRFAKTITRQWAGKTYTLAPGSNRYVIQIPAYQRVLNPELEANPE